jgi:hypothetical protein
LTELTAQVRVKRDELKKFEQQIDKKSVDKLCKLLEKRCPEVLGKMVESMVALLRGHNYANSSDVKLYLMNYEGLIYKMQRVDSALIPEEAIKLNEKKLEAMIKSFTDETDKDFEVNSQFVHLFAWTMHFCSVCKFSRSVKFIED